MFDSSDKIDKWFSERRSRFTASENYKLLGVGAGNYVFGTGGNTYIEQKALELVTAFWERPELEEVASLLWGKVYEYPAYESYIRETRNHQMTYMGSENPTFLTYDALPDESGGTPDVVNITSDNKVDYGCELKCPKNPIYHFRRLKWQDQWDVKQHYILVYTQIQFLMMITGAFGWDFVSYDERQLSKKNKIKIIQIKPDQKFQDNLDMRIRLAIKEKYRILSEHLGFEVKDRKHILQMQNGYK